MHKQAPPSPPPVSHTSRPRHTCTRTHTEHFPTRNNTGCPEETLQLLCFFVFQLLVLEMHSEANQQLAGIRTRSDRIWGLRLKKKGIKKEKVSNLDAPKLHQSVVCLYSHACIQCMFRPLFPAACMGPAPTSVMIAQLEKEV